MLAAVADPLDGELGVLVETIDPSRGCPECGVVGQVKQRPVVSVRDGTSAGRRVRVGVAEAAVGVPGPGLLSEQLD